MKLFDALRAYLSSDDTAIRAREDDVTTLRDPEAPRKLFDSTHALTPERALSVPALWRGVDLISTALATLPFEPMRRAPNGDKFPNVEDPLYEIVKGDANDELSWVEFVILSMVRVFMRGNTFAFIERYGDGSPAALWPLDPTRVTPARDSAKNLYWKVTRPDGQEDVWPDRDIFRLRGLSLNGVTGLSLIDIARRTLRLPIAAEQHAIGFYENGGTSVGGIFTIPAGTPPEVEAKLREEIRKRHEGAAQAYRHLFLKNGLTFTAADTMSASDAQFVEGLNFSVYDIARLLGVRPSRLNAEGSTSYSSQEQDDNEFVQDTLRPWAVRWEAEIRRKLIPRDLRRTTFVEINLDARTRGNLKDQYDAFAVGRQHGWLSVNDIRRRIGLPSIDGGDIYLQQLNTIDAAEATAFLKSGRSADSTDEADDAEDTEETDATRSARLAALTLALGTHRRMARVYAERSTKQTDDTRGAFVEEFRTKYTDAMRPVCAVLAPLEGQTADDLIANFWQELHAA